MEYCGDGDVMNNRPKVDRIIRIWISGLGSI